jgi:hypothetical protein
MADEPNDDYMDLDEGAAALEEALQDELADDKEPDQDESEEPEGDEEEAQDSESDEPGEPAIEAPVTLNPEDRAKFAQLPLEAQRIMAEIETRRNRQVTEVTTGAANAQREAQASAAGAIAQAQRHYASQFTALANAYAPQPPNPADYSDIQQYQRENAQYEFRARQHQQLMQQIGGIHAEAQTIDERLMADRKQANEQKLREILPDWFDAEKRPKLEQDLINVGSDLGYSRELMAQADAGDLAALNRALAWKQKAAKYDAIVGKQMAGVRAQRKTVTPGVAQPQGAQRQQAQKSATQRLAKTGSLEDAASAIAAQLG